MKTMGKLVLAVISLLTLLAVAPLSSANAAEPVLAITSPSSGSTTGARTVSFAGTTTDGSATDLVKLTITTPQGSTVTAEAMPAGETWSVESVVLPEDGTYTAVAEQTIFPFVPGKSPPVAFTINTVPPTVTLDQPSSPSKNTSPSFTGTATDTTLVVVHIYKQGAEVSSATASGNGGAWASTAASPALSEGEYTAVATQESSLGNEGKSLPVSFTIHTAPPEVTLQQPSSPSKNTSPSFTGTATDTTLVVVHIYKQGAEVSSATASGNGGAWASTAASPALSEGEYTAVATQESSLGNEGKSLPVSFTIYAAPPEVTLQQPPSPSKSTTPSFNGTATDTTLVVVHISDSLGHEVASAQASGNGGAWASTAASPALSEGEYTAVATQESSLGNEGKSSPVVFTIHTAPPVVKLDQPLAHSNNAMPTFTGTASDTTPVKVKVYLGTKATGSPLATATALPGAGGAWESGQATLPTAKHTYTAVASQESSLGNPTGTSPPVTFAVDTEAPSVTLNKPPPQTNNATPSFTGTASEKNPVTVDIYAGSTIPGPGSGPAPVAVATAGGTGGGWATGPASPALPDGSYVAVATQESSYGHGPGGAGPARFVVDTVAPNVTLSRPSDGSSTSGGTQAVQGTAGTAAGDLAQVTVQLFTGSQIAAGQSPAQSVQVPATGGQWSVTLAGLSPGRYVVRAEQADRAGNVGMSTATSFSVLASAAAVTQGGPSASFSWSPSTPRVGEMVSLLSSSTDAASPIATFSWDLSGTGAFLDGGPVSGTSFSAPGKHVVQLRVADATGASSVAAETIDVAPSSMRLMQPFPTVRIAASGSGAGIRLKLLSIRAPVGAHIAVGCSGKGCPVKSQSRVAAVGKSGMATLEFRRFERVLKPGTVLEIRISKAGEIGKYTRFAVRRGRLPVRSDACIRSAAGKPIACPSS